VVLVTEARRRHDQDRHCLKCGIVTKFDEELEAVHFRHDEVQKNEIWPSLGDTL
jgi:hypothetical protein